MSTRTDIGVRSEVELAELGESDSQLGVEEAQEDPKLKTREFRGRQVAMMAFGTKPPDNPITMRCNNRERLLVQVRGGIIRGRSGIVLAWFYVDGDCSVLRFGNFHPYNTTDRYRLPWEK